MTWKLNSAGRSNLDSHIGDGKHVDTAWSFSAEDGNKLLGEDGDDWGNYSKWHLGIDPEGDKKSRGAYSYPFGKGDDVNLHALRAIISDASGGRGAEANDAIAGAAKAALEKAEPKDDDKSAAPAIIVRKREREELCLAKYGNIVEGPTGHAMPESIARAIDEAKKTASREVGIPYRRLAANSDPNEFDLDDKSRTDVSYITTDAIDRDGEVVLPSGMDNRQYNGVVPFAHQYTQPPVGRNHWIKAKNNGLIGKTQYAPKPKDWSGDWLADAVVGLMQMDPPTCTGKSIGFIPTSYRPPTPDEIRSRPELAECRAMIPTWKLMEYSVAPVPANPEAEMLQVSKSWGPEEAEAYAAAIKSICPIIASAKKQAVVAKAFVSNETIAKIVAERLDQQRKRAMQQFGRRAADALQDRLHQMMGTP